MKIVRHVARDMRQAMRAIRERLGEDAVILSSRRTSDGVEVTAAVDFDAESLEGTPIQPLAGTVESPLIRREAGRSGRDATPATRDAVRPPLESATQPKRAAVDYRETPRIRDEDEPVHSKVPPTFDDAPTCEQPPIAQQLDVAPLPSMPCGIEAGSPLISRELQTALLDSLVVSREEPSRATSSAAARGKSSASVPQPARAPAVREVAHSIHDEEATFAASSWPSKEL